MPACRRRVTVVPDDLQAGRQGGDFKGIECPPGIAFTDACQVGQCVVIGVQGRTAQPALVRQRAAQECDDDLLGERLQLENLGAGG